MNFDSSVPRVRPEGIITERDPENIRTFWELNLNLVMSEIKMRHSDFNCATVKRVQNLRGCASHKKDGKEIACIPLGLHKAYGEAGRTLLFMF